MNRALDALVKHRLNDFEKVYEGLGQFEPYNVGKLLRLV